MSLGSSDDLVVVVADPPFPFDDDLAFPLLFLFFFLPPLAGVSMSCKKPSSSGIVAPSSRSDNAESRAFTAPDPSPVTVMESAAMELLSAPSPTERAVDDVDAILRGVSPGSRPSRPRPSLSLVVVLRPLVLVVVPGLPVLCLVSGRVLVSGRSSSSIVRFLILSSACMSAALGVEGARAGGGGGGGGGRGQRGRMSHPPRQVE